MLNILLRIYEIKSERRKEKKSGVNSLIKKF